MKGRLIRFARPIGTVVVLLLTVGVFVNYFLTHAEVRHQLGHTPVGLLLLLICLYVGAVGALALVTAATIRLCGVRIKASETYLLTAYSSIINFFGPLQSGPAFRLIYLKQKHGLK